jgi:micrococcal nuclease
MMVKDGIHDGAWRTMLRMGGSLTGNTSDTQSPGSGERSAVEQEAPVPTPPPAPEPVPAAPPRGNCDPAYPDVCIPPPPPDLNCGDVAPHCRFRVLAPDPHQFDGDGDGLGCERCP